jgi:hypothetical protein
MKKIYLFLGIVPLFMACENDPQVNPIVEINFKEVARVQIGGTAAAEITAYDPITKQLFVVNNSAGSTVDIIEFSGTGNVYKKGSIAVAPFGGGVNSVAVTNGLLAMAVEASTKTDNGSVVIFRTDNLTRPIANVKVGALPDMVTFSPNGRFIVTANEGEPNANYSIDPVGSVSIIDVFNNFQVATLGFDGFESRKNELISRGYRVFGPGANLAKDTEPEYVTIDQNSEVAWVTLQENNGIARVNLMKQTIEDIFPMGLKDIRQPGNEMDASDRDGGVNLKNWPIYSFYMPDAITYFHSGNTNYIITANEGDTREYSTYAEEVRVKDIRLNPVQFPDWAELRKDNNIGRYTITKSAGDDNQDGIYETLYGIGGRSFTVWNGDNGQKVVDYNRLEIDFLAAAASLYDDGRSDNKGVEPEAITIGQIHDKQLVFVGLERTDGIMVYEQNGVSGFNFVQLIQTGDAPEGLLFIPASQSPNGKDLLVVSSEGDGVIRVYQN